MSVDSFNGVATPKVSTTRTPGTAVWTDGEVPPNTRLAANAMRPVLVTRARMYLAGYLEDAQVAIQFGTDNSFTTSFYVKQSASAQPTGWQTLDAYFANGSGTAQRLTVSTTKSLVFGRGNGAGGTTTDTAGNSWNGGLAGEFEWAQAPSEPRGLSARPDSTSVLLNWITPSDDGDSSITDYIVQYSTSSTFASGVTQIVTSSSVTAYTVSGLTGANRYYFRVAARNAVTNRAMTWSIFSNTATARPLSGGNGTDLDPGYSLPDPPASLAVQPSNNVLDMFWPTPTNTGGVPLTGYQLQVSTDSSFPTPLTYAPGVNTNSYSVTGLTSNTVYYARIRTQNSIGYSAWTTTQQSTTPPRSTLDAVGSGAIHIDRGIQVELRTNGAESATIQIGYIALDQGTNFAVIDTVPTGTSDGLFATYGNQNSLAITADVTGNLYVIGRNGGTNAGLLVKQYLRTGTTSWALNGSASSGLTDNGQPIIQFAAEYMAGSQTDSIFVAVRRAGPYTAGNLSFATINPAMVATSNSGSMLIQAGTDPTFFPAPPVSTAGAYGTLDTSKLDDQRLVLAANGFTVLNVLNGVVSTIAKSPDRTDWYGDKIRVHAVSANEFVILRAYNSSMSMYVANTNGQQYIRQEYGNSYAYGGFNTNWDSYFNRQNRLVYIYFVPASSPNNLYFFTLSGVTYQTFGITTLTGALGASGSINGRVRAPQGTVDERKVVMEVTNLNGSTQSLLSFADTTGNVQPRTPTLNQRPPFDANLASNFYWSYGDFNSVDAQGSYQLQIDLVSTGANVYDTARTYSLNSAATVPANTLVDENRYRWRVRTYDLLGSVSDWSNYGYFMTQDAGQVIITRPSADSTTTSNDYVDLAWIVSTTGTGVQGSRQIKTYDNTTGNLVYDTGVQGTTDQSYRQNNLQSGTTYRFEVTAFSQQNIASVAGTRTVVISYSQPSTPSLDLTVYNEFIRVTIRNPDDGARPRAGRNDIYRRETGSGAAFVKIGSSRPNTDYFDYAVASGVQYDYRIRAVSAT